MSYYVKGNSLLLISNFIDLFQFHAALEGIMLLIILSTSLITMLCIINQVQINLTTNVNRNFNQESDDENMSSDLEDLEYDDENIADEEELIQNNSQPATLYSSNQITKTYQLKGKHKDRISLY